MNNDIHDIYVINNNFNEKILNTLNLKNFHPINEEITILDDINGIKNIYENNKIKYALILLFHTINTDPENNNNTYKSIDNINNLLKIIKNDNETYRKIIILNITNSIDAVILTHGFIFVCNILNIPNNIYFSYNFKSITSCNKIKNDKNKVRNKNSSSLDNLAIINDKIYVVDNNCVNEISNGKNKLFLFHFNIDVNDNLNIKYKGSIKQVKYVSQKFNQFRYIITELGNDYDTIIDNLLKIEDSLINDVNNKFHSKISYIQKYFTNYFPEKLKKYEYFFYNLILSEKFYTIFKYYYHNYFVNNKLSDSITNYINNYDIKNKLDANINANIFMLLLSKFILKKNINSVSTNYSIDNNVIQSNYNNYNIESFYNSSSDLSFYYYILKSIFNNKEITDFKETNFKLDYNRRKIEKKIKTEDEYLNYEPEFCIIEATIKNDKKTKDVLLCGFISDNDYYLFDSITRKIIKYPWNKNIIENKDGYNFVNYLLVFYIKKDFIKITEENNTISSSVNPQLNIIEYNKINIQTDILKNKRIDTYVIINEKDIDYNRFFNKNLNYQSDLDSFIENIFNKNKENHKLIILKTRYNEEESKQSLENINKINNFLQNKEINPLNNVTIINYTNSTELVVYNNKICNVINMFCLSDVLYSDIQINNINNIIENYKSTKNKLDVYLTKNIIIKTIDKQIKTDKNINYMFTYYNNINDVIDFFIHKNICGYGRIKQLSGTCWLNSVINTLILPEHMTNVLISIYISHTNTNILLKNEIENSDFKECLLKDYDVTKQILGIIYNILIKNNIIKKEDSNIIAKMAYIIKFYYDPKNIGKNFEIPNTNTLNNTINGGDTLAALYYIYKYILGDCYDMIAYKNDNNTTLNNITNLNKKIIFTITYEKDIVSTFDENITIDKSVFKLESCIIEFSGKKPYNHVVCGFICNNKYFIYDSNEKNITIFQGEKKLLYEYNWQNNLQNLLKDKNYGNVYNTYKNVKIIAANYINISQMQ